MNQTAPTKMETEPQIPPVSVIDSIAKLINDHPFPSIPLRPLLIHHLLPHLLPHSPSSSLLLSSLLHRLFSSHKSLELFRFSLLHSPSTLSPSSLTILLNSLSRSPRLLFPSSAFLVLDLIRRAVPSLLSPSALYALLSPLARHSTDPFASTLRAFARAELIWSAACRPPFGAPELTAVLRAFCASSRLAEARAAFRLLYSRHPPDSRSFNTLLLGFRVAGSVAALERFYQELLLRRFEPDVVTYNIRIDAYCKKNRFFEALQLVTEMEARGISPTVRTITTLIHGAGIAREAALARQLFDGMTKRGISADRGCYNALMGAFVRVGDIKAGLMMLDEMELKRVEMDDVSYYTMLCGYRNSMDFDGVLRIYRRMIATGFLPRTRTVMLLMKFFRDKSRLDLGLELWDYLLGKGCCPHRHALDILAKGLCFSGQVAEVYECFKQVVERGRLPSQRGIQLLEEFLVKAQDKKLEVFREMIRTLKTRVPIA